jgi:hypothetical protein
VTLLSGALRWQCWPGIILVERQILRRQVAPALLDVRGSCLYWTWRA